MSSGDPSIPGDLTARDLLAQAFNVNNITGPVDLVPVVHRIMEVAYPGVELSGSASDSEGTVTFDIQGYKVPLNLWIANTALASDNLLEFQGGIRTPTHQGDLSGSLKTVDAETVSQMRLPAEWLDVTRVPGVVFLQVNVEFQDGVLTPPPTELLIALVLETSGQGTVEVRAGCETRDECVCNATNPDVQCRNMSDCQMHVICREDGEKQCVKRRVHGGVPGSGVLMGLVLFGGALCLWRKASA